MQTIDFLLIDGMAKGAATPNCWISGIDIIKFNNKD